MVRLVKLDDGVPKVILELPLEDLFLPFFKFAIEGKFQFGTRNVLIPDDSIYARPLEQLKTRTFVISLCFEG